jgi:ankyrin repeat protein
MHIHDYEQTLFNALMGKDSDLALRMVTSPQFNPDAHCRLATTDKRSILHWAMINNHVKAAMIIADKGAEKKLALLLFKDNFGKLPLDYVDLFTREGRRIYSYCTHKHQTNINSFREYRSNKIFQDFSFTEIMKQPVEQIFGLLQRIDFSNSLSLTGSSKLDFVTTIFGTCVNTKEETKKLDLLVRRLLQEGANPNLKNLREFDGYANTSLHKTLANEAPKVAMCFLQAANEESEKHGTIPLDFTVTDAAGKTTLLIAAMLKQNKCFDYIINNGGETAKKSLMIDDENEQNVLHAICMVGNDEAFFSLVGFTQQYQLLTQEADRQGRLPFQLLTTSPQELDDYLFWIDVDPNRDANAPVNQADKLRIPYQRARISYREKCLRGRQIIANHIGHYGR